MRALIQRVKEAHVTISGKRHSEIGVGMLILLGIRQTDNDTDAEYLAQRCADLRIFSDANGKMNHSIKDICGSALVVSQVTLYADTRRGNRPSLTDSAPPAEAERLYEAFVGALRRQIGVDCVRTGVFRAMMDVGLINDGPVSVMLESRETREVSE